MSHPLHDLAAKIEKLTAEHPAYSQAHMVVRNCVDHLQAVARVHEVNADSVQSAELSRQSAAPPYLSMRWGAVYNISTGQDETSLDILVKGRHYVTSFVTPRDAPLTTPRLPQPSFGQWTEHLLPVAGFITQLRILAGLAERAI